MITIFRAFDDLLLITDRYGHISIQQNLFYLPQEHELQGTYYLASLPGTRGLCTSSPKYHALFAQ